MNRFHLLLAALMAALGVLLAPAAMAAPAFPKLTGRVVDQAGIIPPDVQKRLTGKLAALEKQSGRQVVVVTLSSLNGYEIGDYGYQLGREWGIGQKKENNGTLLIVAPNERAVRIEVGYGLEPILTDAWSWFIIRDEILPRFKAGDYPGGIEAGTDAIIKQITLPPEEAAKVAEAAKQAQQESNEGSPLAGLIVLVIIIIFFVIPLIRAISGGGRKHRYGHRNAGSALGEIALWTALSALSDGDHDGGGGWGGGFGGGGGFSGGGGSFGGGGASGSW